MVITNNFAAAARHLLSASAIKLFIHSKHNLIWARAKALVIKFATVCLLLTTMHNTGAEQLSGYVIGVTDGDTLTLLVEQQPRKVRIVGIDAPERHQPFGEKSKQNLSKLAFNKAVIADCPKKDRYKRDLCKVMIDGQDVGLKQVADGMAWWYRKYAHEQTLTDRAVYEQAEMAARNGRLGLWADAEPVPPWEWRKQGWSQERSGGSLLDGRYKF